MVCTTVNQQSSSHCWIYTSTMELQNNNIQWTKNVGTLLPHKNACNPLAPKRQNMYIYDILKHYYFIGRPNTEQVCWKKNLAHTTQQFSNWTSARSRTRNVTNIHDCNEYSEHLTDPRLNERCDLLNSIEHFSIILKSSSPYVFPRWSVWVRVC